MSTFYNLHIYVEGNEILHVVTNKRKHIDIANSGNLFLSELEDLKSCE